MPDRFYMRKWRILVSDDSGKPVFDSLPGVTGQPGNALDLSNLRCVFRTEKNYGQTYQFAEITVYNLNAETETALMARAQTVVIEAGYRDGAYGTIFTGTVYQPMRGKEDGVTHFLKLVCIDSDDMLNLGFCNFTMPGGYTARQIALQTARSSTVPFELEINADLSEQKTERGKTVFGQPKDILRSIAADNNAAFRMEDGKGHIDGLNRQPTSDLVVILNAQTGLIGMPQQIEKGVTLQCLINPDIKINNFVKINNADIQQEQIAFGTLHLPLDLDGLYRVIKIVATGDTRGNDWYYELETVTQLGFLPAMMTDQYQSGF